MVKGVIFNIVSEITEYVFIIISSNGDFFFFLNLCGIIHVRVAF